MTNNLSFLRLRTTDPNWVDERTGRTALMIAIERFSGNTISLLLSRGADVNKINPVTKTSPLIESCRRNFLEGVQILLNNGADVTYSNPVTGEYALEAAVKFANNDVLKLLVDNPRINIDQINAITGMGILATARQRTNFRSISEILQNRVQSPQQSSSTTIQLTGGGTYTIDLNMFSPATKNSIISAIQRTLKQDGTVYELPSGFQFSQDDKINVTLRQDGYIKYAYSDGDLIFDEKEYNDYLSSVAERVQYLPTLPDDFRCAVCLGPFYDPCFSSCGSVYCRGCLQSILNYGIKHDPLTRREINKTVTPCDIIRRLMLNYVEN
jgi:ankyrin repeat protein